MHALVTTIGYRRPLQEIVQHELLPRNAMGGGDDLDKL
jgi:hypothetical protein